MGAKASVLQVIKGTQRPLPPGNETDGDEVFRGETIAVQMKTHKKLGAGAHSEVYQVSVRESEENDYVLAALKVKLASGNTDREVSVLRALNHANIMRLLYFYKTEDSVNLVMEYIPGTVHHAINDAKQRDRTLPLNEVKLWSYQMLRALKYMHSMQLCHRDVKPSNLLLNRATGLLKLGDFGSAKRIEPNMENVTYIVSRWYRAPELIKGNAHYSVQIDVWAAGCVVGEMLSNNVLFMEHRDDRHLLSIMRMLGTPTAQQMSDMGGKPIPSLTCHQVEGRGWGHICPPVAADLVTHLLQWSPTQRFTAQTALNHQFFNNINTVALPSGKHIDPHIFQ